MKSTLPILSETEALAAFCQRMTGQPAAQMAPLFGGGSDRRYYRVECGGQSYVAVAGDNLPENRAFIGFSQTFASLSIPVAAIYGVDEAQGFYLMEDLGPQTLRQALEGWRKGGDEAGEEKAMAALEQVVDWLPVIQVKGGAALDYGLCHEGDELGPDAFAHDVRQFVAHYVGGHRKLPPPPPPVEQDLGRLLTELAQEPRDHFCYRDFQSRNIMWRNGQPWFIDFQSGRRGPLAYDLVSLLYSPDTGLSQPQREALTGRYLEALARQGVAVEPQRFLDRFYGFVMVRRMQALGAYTYLAHHKDKPLLLEKIPATQATLAALLAKPQVLAGHPHLKSWLAGLF